MPARPLTRQPVGSAGAGPAPVSAAAALPGDVRRSVADGIGWRLATSAPELMTAALAGFSAVAVGLLLVGRFEIGLVLPLGVLAAALCAALAGAEPPPEDPRERWFPAAAVVIAAISVLLNAVWSAQNIYAIRDPATYALAGQWLTSHSSISIATHPEIFGVRGLSLASAGFGYDGAGRVYAQGNHLLPALLAVGGWAGGPAVLLKVNCLLGGGALLAFFGFTRRLAGGAWALVAMIALGVSMPMIGFTRQTYTEPLTLLLLFGGLSLLWRAQESGRVRAYAVAGLVIGAASMARVDGYVAELTLLVVATGVLAAAPAGTRLRALVRVGALLVAAAVPVRLALTDVKEFSSGYFRDTSAELGSIGKAAVALAVLGVLTVAASWGRPTLRTGVSRLLRRLAPAGAGLVVLVFAVLATRPWWFLARNNEPPGWPVLAQLQHALRVTVDPKRSYEEMSITWLSWYYGWPAVALAVIGVALLVARLLRRGDLRLLGMLTMTLSLALLYLNQAKIFPDQIWAMRRFLPVVIPGLLAAAAFALALLWGSGSWRRPAAAVLGAVALVLPLVTSGRLIPVREYVPELAEVRQVCSALPPDAAVLTVDRLLTSGYDQTLRAFCDVPAEGLDGATPAQLQAARAVALAAGRRLFVLSQVRASLPYPPGTPPPRPLTSVLLSKWPERLDEPPAHRSVFPRSLWLGAVRPDGYVQPVAG